MRIKADVEVLQQIPVFANSDEAHLQLLSFSAKQVELEAGSILFQKGMQAGAVYLVIEGKAEIYEDAEGAGEVIATAERGALLGEVSMVANSAYRVTVKTVSPFKAKRIERDLMLRMIAEFPEFGLGIMRNVALQLGRSLESLKELMPLFQAPA